MIWKYLKFQNGMFNHWLDMSTSHSLHWTNVVLPTPTKSQRTNHQPTLAQRRHAVWVIQKNKRRSKNIYWLTDCINIHCVKINGYSSKRTVLIGLFSLQFGYRNIFEVFLDSVSQHFDFTWNGAGHLKKCSCKILTRVLFMVK